MESVVYAAVCSHSILTACPPYRRKELNIDWLHTESLNGGVGQLDIKGGARGCCGVLDWVVGRIGCSQLLMCAAHMVVLVSTSEQAHCAAGPEVVCARRRLGEQQRGLDLLCCQSSGIARTWPVVRAAVCSHLACCFLSTTKNSSKDGHMLLLLSLFCFCPDNLPDPAEVAEERGESGRLGVVTVGFGHDAVLGVAGAVVDAVKTGEWFWQRGSWN